MHGPTESGSSASRPSAWPHYVREILGGDTVVALGYRTPAGGVVMVPVTTLGMCDPDAGTVTTTTSFGNWRKLTRLEQDDRVALFYHTRLHGTADQPHLVLVQGNASFPDRADVNAWMTADVVETWNRILVPRKRGRFWDWIGLEYYEERIPITVAIHRMTAWDEQGDLVEVIGAPAVTDPPASQIPPAGGTGARVTPRAYGKRLHRSRHHLIGYVGVDGYPEIHPVDVQPSQGAIEVRGRRLAPGARRAGMLGHWFEPRLKGQGAAILTGWWEVADGKGTYAPHTVAGYSMPRVNDFMFSLGAGLVTKLGYRQAVKQGRVRDGQWQRHGGSR